MIADFEVSGNLPPGIHSSTWNEVCDRFGFTRYRLILLKGLEAALRELQKAGCKKVYVDGSFATSKEIPGDYDCCWETDDVDPDLLDPILLTSDNRSAAQKTKYLGELFPISGQDGNQRAILDFFQVDKETGQAKGIVALDLGGFT